MYDTIDDMHEDNNISLTAEQETIAKFIIQNMARLASAIRENEELQIKSRVAFNEEQARAFIYGDNDEEILTRLNYAGSVRSFYRRLENYIKKFVAQYDIEGSKQAPLYLKADGTRTRREILPLPIKKSC